MRVRFSLRGLLIVTALLAAFCYWRDRPRQIANQFVAAFESKDRVTLNRLLTPVFPMNLKRDDA